MTSTFPPCFVGRDFSFASAFLFVAILPLAYAPETLNLKERESKMFANKAMRVKLKVDKEARKL
jgi:hypothetical protein